MQDVPVAARRDEDTHSATWHDESQGLQHPHGLTGDRSGDVELSANVVQPQDVTRLQVTPGAVEQESLGSDAPPAELPRAEAA